MEFKNISRELNEIAKDYDYQQPPDILLKLQELIASGLRFLKDLFNYFKIPQFETSDSTAVATILQLIVVFVGVVAAVMVVLLVASRLRQWQLQKQAAIGTIIAEDGPLDSKGWSTLAEQLSERGSYKEACRAVYMSILLLLEEEKVMAFAATKTNYEYFYALKRMPNIATNFRQLVDRVEELWFGDRQATGADYKDCREQARSIINALPAAKPKILTATAAALHATEPVIKSTSEPK